MDANTCMFVADFNIVSDSTITNGDKTVCTRMRRVFSKNRNKTIYLAHYNTFIFA